MSAHHLLNLCGLAVEAEYRDFVGSPPAYGEELILVARVARRGSRSMNTASSSAGRAK